MLSLWIKNGGFVPYIYFILIAITCNNLFSVAVCLRLTTINHFFWFADWTILGQLKQFVRFTDCGTLVSLLNYYGGEIELSRNITFLITFGFWIGFCCGIKETLVINDVGRIDNTISTLYHYLNHGLLYSIICCQNGGGSGGGEGLKATSLFILFYLGFIFVPWYYITGDFIYNV